MADNCRMYLGPQTMIEGVLLPIAGSEELGPAAAWHFSSASMNSLHTGRDVNRALAMLNEGCERA